MPVATGADTYPTWVGLVYILNLMVGTGALALPHALVGAGTVLGTAVLLGLALLSLLAASFLLEAHSAVVLLRGRASAAAAVTVLDEAPPSAGPDCAEEAGGGEEAPLVSPPHAPRKHRRALAEHSLDQRVELSEMCAELLGARGRLACALALVVYLYGDLSIYSAAIATSLKDVICTYRPNGTDWANATRLPDDTTCWEPETAAVTRGAAYRAALLAGTLLLAPLTACDLRATRHLQILTSACRWLALGSMIGVASSRLWTAGAAGAPAVAHAGGVPALLGTCVYSFMWHHSAPGLVAPMRSKRALLGRLALVAAVAAAAYLALALTAAFAFASLDPLYSLDFAAPPGASAPRRALHLLLALFPVLTLSASYPVVAVTLRRNLAVLSGWHPVAVGVLAVAPPLLLTLLVSDVGLLVSGTGALAGVCVQYVVPALLVTAARRRAGGGGPHASPARHPAAPLLLHAWAAACALLLLLHLALPAGSVR